MGGATFVQNFLEILLSLSEVKYICPALKPCPPVQAFGVNRRDGGYGKRRILSVS